MFQSLRSRAACMRRSAYILILIQEGIVKKFPIDVVTMSR